ncbi:unnamed protein product [Effrenium voratum]|uniref:Uncharacterized protein n=1 Tax=Effrenium voratum TaxID=2562239 RepID=A0AA36JS15_9DINO|nr:unnamed protein product [Effrenium voratum]
MAFRWPGSRVVQTHGECQLAIHIRLDLRVLPAAGLMWQAERRGQGNPTVCKGALSQLARKELLWL